MENATYKIKDTIQILAGLISIGAVIYMAGAFSQRLYNLEDNFKEEKSINEAFRKQMTDDITDIKTLLAKITTTLKIN